MWYNACWWSRDVGVHKRQRRTAVCRMSCTHKCGHKAVTHGSDMQSQSTIDKQQRLLSGNNTHTHVCECSRAPSWRRHRMPRPRARCGGVGLSRGRCNPPCGSSGRKPLYNPDGIGGPERSGAPEGRLSATLPHRRRGLISCGARLVSSCCSCSPQLRGA